MSTQQLKVVALGLAVLLLLWGGSELFSRGSDTVTGSLALPPLTAADVDSIVLQSSDSTVLVKQSPTAWTVLIRLAMTGPDAGNPAGGGVSQ